MSMLLSSDLDRDNVKEVYIPEALCYSVDARLPK